MLRFLVRINLWSSACTWSTFAENDVSVAWVRCRWSDRQWTRLSVIQTWTVINSYILCIVLLAKSASVLCVCVEVEVRTPRSLNARLGFAVVRLARDVSSSGSQAHHGHKLASLTRSSDSSLTDGLMHVRIAQLYLNKILVADTVHTFRIASRRSWAPDDRRFPAVGYALLIFWYGWAKLNRLAWAE
jgi:hypothetical protein